MVKRHNQENTCVIVYPVDLGDLLSIEQENMHRQMIESLREEFLFDFVGLAPVPKTDPPELMWKYASGNSNRRFERIVLPPGVGVMGIVYGSRRPLVVENVAQDIPLTDQYQYPIVAAEGLVSFFALPLLRKNELTFILLCAFRSDHIIDQALLEKTASFIGGISDDYTALLDNPVRPSYSISETTYDGTTHKILQAQEEERKRISRELHDGISQEILLAQIELRKLKYLPDEEKDEGIERASEYLRQIMKHVNTIAIGLRPTQLDELGLGSAIKAYGLMLQDSYGVTVSLDVDPTISLANDHEIALYRIFQEAASNACKYSRSESIEVVLKEESDLIYLSVQDFGIGFVPGEVDVRGSGLGIVGMQERSELIGGTFYLSSLPHEGTFIQVTLPAQGSSK